MVDASGQAVDYESTVHVPIGQHLDALLEPAAALRWHLPQTCLDLRGLAVPLDVEANRIARLLLAQKLRERRVRLQLLFVHGGDDVALAKACTRSRGPRRDLAYHDALLTRLDAELRGNS